jgi:hypothetical protein
MPGANSTTWAGASAKGAAFGSATVRLTAIGSNAGSPM